MLLARLRYNLIDVMTAINIEILVVMSWLCSLGTDPNDPKDELNTLHTITGKSKYLDIDLNSRNLFLCLSLIKILFILILSKILMTSSFHFSECIYY
jgi:hypothetical protein